MDCFFCKTLGKGALGWTVSESRIHGTFSGLTSCIEGTGAEKTGLAAARARKTVVKRIERESDL